MLYSMCFQNLAIHQQTKIWDTFKLAIGYDTAMTTLCQSLGSQGSHGSTQAKGRKNRNVLPIPNSLSISI